jgi:hypothetical protein
MRHNTAAFTRIQIIFQAEWRCCTGMGGNHSPRQYSENGNNNESTQWESSIKEPVTISARQDQSVHFNNSSKRDSDAKIMLTQSSHCAERCW